MTEIGSEIINQRIRRVRRVRTSAIYVPPVTVEELLVEDGAVGTQEGDGVKVLGVHRILNKKIKLLN